MLHRTFYTGPPLEVRHEHYPKRGRVDDRAPVRVSHEVRIAAPATPATDSGRAGAGQRTAWLQLAALATTLTAWLRHTGLDGELARASTKTLRFRILSAPGRRITHARRRILKIPPGWAWSGDLTTAWDRIQALHPT